MIFLRYLPPTKEEVMRSSVSVCLSVNILLLAGLLKNGWNDLYDMFNSLPHSDAARQIFFKTKITYNIIAKNAKIIYI